MDKETKQLIFGITLTVLIFGLSLYLRLKK
jgi:hypothetical protein